MTGEGKDSSLRSTLDKHSGSPFFRAEVDAILDSAEVRGGARVADLGCGNGFLVAKARASGVLAVGLESAREIVLAARTLTSADAFLRAAAEHLPFRRESFDAIVAQHIIEHLPNPAAAIADWHRVLRPGGRLVVLTPNARYPDPAIFDDPTHVRIFNRRNLAALLVAANFRVLEAATMFPYLRGHVVFGLRHRDFFRHLPPWSSSGRSLLCVGEKRGTEPA